MSLDSEQPETGRRLKVYSVQTGSGQALPQLRLQGAWLEKLGFPPDCRIEVTGGNGTLLIRRMDTVKVLVVGSRSIPAFDLSPYIPADCGLIISGGAPGIDRIAEQYATDYNIATQILKPDYKRFSKGAPLKRDEQMVEMADLVIAVWDGESRGTKYSIDYAKKTGKPVRVIQVKTEVTELE